MKRPRYIAGVDIGSTKVFTIIVDVSHEGRPRVLGSSWVASAGMQRGAVVDLEAVSKALAESVDVAERTSGRKIESAFFGIADEHVRSVNRKGRTVVGPKPRTIGSAHVKRAVETTMGFDLESGSEVLHFVPRAFCVDDQHVVQNPVGMLGRRLEVETHIVIGSSNSVVNSMAAIHHHGLEIDELVVGPLAAAESVLTAEERQMGAMLLDIGGETTDIVVFSDGGVSYTGVVGLGGVQVTSDLAIGLRTPIYIAEQVKVKSGRCLVHGIPSSELVNVPSFDQGDDEQVSLRFVAEICQARMEEIFDAVIDEVAASGFRAPLPGGVVLTGGAASLMGAIELARHHFDLPARLGVPIGLGEDGAGLVSPALAVGVGLVLWGMRNGHPDQRGNEDEGWESMVRRLGRWLRHLMP